MTPAGVVHLIRNNHEVFIQKGAGLGSVSQMLSMLKQEQNC